MSSLHAAIHAQTGSHDTLVETISAVNRYLADNIPPNRFVTLFMLSSILNQVRCLSLTPVTIRL